MKEEANILITIVKIDILQKSELELTGFDCLFWLAESIQKTFGSNDHLA